MLTTNINSYTAWLYLAYHCKEIGPEKIVHLLHHPISKSIFQPQRFRSRQGIDCLPLLFILANSCSDITCLYQVVLYSVTDSPHG